MTATLRKGFRRFLVCLPIFVAMCTGLASLPVVADDEDEEGVVATSRYVEIQPAFVTNYGGGDRLRYMKVEVTLRVLGTAGEKQVSHHMPYIKDILLSLFAVQTRDSIATAEGKEDLRKQALGAVSKILEEEDKTSHLQDLLFTSFVAHR